MAHDTFFSAEDMFINTTESLYDSIIGVDEFDDVLPGDNRRRDHYVNEYGEVKSWEDYA